MCFHLDFPIRSVQHVLYCFLLHIFARFPLCAWVFVAVGSRCLHPQLPPLSDQLSDYWKIAGGGIITLGYVCPLSVDPLFRPTAAQASTALVLGAGCSWESKLRKPHVCAQTAVISGEIDLNIVLHNRAPFLERALWIFCEANQR